MKQLLENMTVSEKHNYERMKKRGYTDEEIKEMLLANRAISPEIKEKAIQSVKKSMMENLIVKFKKED